MSLAVQLTSDKSRFANYFSDPLILSKNTEIAVSKCSGSIPTIVTQTITVPLIPEEQLDDTMLTAIVDSVELLITWRDFYDAWAADANNIENPAIIGVEAFYGGDYELYLNNQISVIDADDKIYNKLSFEELLVEALNSKYEFYNFRNESKYVSGRLNEVYAKTTWKNPYLLQPVEPYKVTRIKNMTLDTFKITATYNADAISLKTPAPIDFTLYPNQVTGWTAAGNTLSNAGGIEALAVVNPFYKIDRNGGFVQWKHTHTGTGLETTYAGLIATAAEVNVVAALLPASAFNPAIACLSLKYASRAEPRGDTFIIQEYGVDKSLEITYAPTNFIFMRFYRTNNFGPEKNTFVVEVWKGNSGTLLPNKLIYSSNISLQNNYSPQPFFYDDGQGDAIGSVFSAVRYIPEGEQTAQQNSSLGSSAAEQNTFSLSSDYTTLGRGDDFFTQIGIPDAARKGLGQTVSESDPNALQHSLSWKPQIDRRYEYKYLGLPSGFKFTTGVMNNLITSTNFDGTIKWSRNNQWYVRDIPRMFEFHIQDVSVKNYEGSYIAGAQNYTTGSISKCVGTISVPREYFSKIDNFNLDFDYEPFTLIYRQINNPDNFAINMMNCNFSYKDFYSNKLNPIDSINGTLKTELHIRIQDEAQRGRLNNQIKPN